MGPFAKWALRAAAVALLLLLVVVGYVWHLTTHKDALPPPDPLLDTRELQVSTADGTVPARLYRSKDAAPGAALLWFHGGGFVGGSIDNGDADAVSRRLAHTGVLVLSVDYRHVPPLAGADTWFGEPAVRFPGPVLDGVAGWRQLLKESAARGIPASHAFIGGASAGGNIAAMTTIFAHRDSLPTPAGVLLAYPLVHAALPGNDGVHRLALVFAGGRNAANVDDAFPKAGELAQFPPALIITADDDNLRPSGELFAAALQQAGVQAELRVEPGTQHGFLYKSGTTAFDHVVAAFAAWMHPQQHPNR